MPRPDTLYRQVLDTLRRQIDDGYRPGDRLAGQRALADMHGVGQATVHRALKQLAAEGLVKAVPRSGWLRAGKKRPAAKGRAAKLTRLGLITRRGDGEWQRNDALYGGLLAEAERRGVEVVMVTNPRRSHPAPARNRLELDRVPWNTFDVGLLVEVEDHETVVDPLLHRHKVLAVDRDLTPVGIPSVTFDDREIGRVAARLLWERGHRRVSVTDELTDFGWPVETTWLARRQGFEEELGRRGGELLPEFRVPGGRQVAKRTGPEGLERLADRWLQADPDERPTGLLATHPRVGMAFAAVLQARSSNGPLSGDAATPVDLDVVQVTWHQSGALRTPPGFDPPIPGVRLITLMLDLPLFLTRVLDVAADMAGSSPDNESPGEAARLTCINSIRIT